MGDWNGTLPAALPSGYVPTGAEWVAIRDALASVTDEWDTYTPAWVGSTTQPAIVNGSQLGAFSRSGKLGAYSIAIGMGSSTTFGSGTYTFGLPSGWTAASLSSGSRNGGHAIMRDQSGAVHNSGGVLIASGGTTVEIRANAANVVSNTVPWTWASGDFIYILGRIELA